MHKLGVGSDQLIDCAYVDLLAEHSSSLEPLS
jgi:hypothetical protein